MVFRCTYSSEGLVAKLNPHEGTEGHNKQEFNSFHVLGDVGGLLPRCHGLAKCSVGGWEYDILILDRIAFTIEAMLRQQHQQPPNQRNVPLVNLIWKVVNAAVVASGPENEIICNDWHTANVAITTAAEGEEPQVKRLGEPPQGT